MRRRILTLALVTFACTAEDPGGGGDAGDPMDPATCAECHPKHYQQWLGSMHAYASDDPYFRALNALGQERTEGALGDLCVTCHAPVAAREGATVDGLDLDEVPPRLKGVTCYFCHSAESVEALHDNGIVLADDGVMRGGIHDPVGTPGHRSAYDPLLDGRGLQSSEMCGACHDVVLGDLAIERTYQEWESSFYADLNELDGNPQPWSQRCNSCHMPGSDGPIADAPGARADRRLHDHIMAGPGVFVSDFPDPEQAPILQAALLDAMEELRKPALCASLCVRDAGDKVSIQVWLHDETAGHHWPSGAAQDRRAWVSLQAFRGGAQVYGLGVLGPEDDVDEQAAANPELWALGNVMRDAKGAATHHIWEAASVEPRLLPVATVLGGDPDTWMGRTYEIDGPMPDEVRLRVSLRPMPVALLDELVAAGYLAPEHRAALPTFDVAGAHLDWTPEVAKPSDTAGACVSSSTSCGSPFI